jgi:hypothetical protein
LGNIGLPELDVRSTYLLPGLLHHFFRKVYGGMCSCPLGEPYSVLSCSTPYFEYTAKVGPGYYLLASYQLQVAGLVGIGVVRSGPVVISLLGIHMQKGVDPRR